MKTSNFAASLLLCTLLAACAGVTQQAQAPAKLTGGVLTDPAGMTLYVFDKDVVGSGKSTCNGPCATNWPPLLVKDGASASGDYSVITRDDGKKQWAFKGLPLYYWVKDQKPGDTSGDGVNKVWRVVKP